MRIIKLLLITASSLSISACGGGGGGANGGESLAGKQTTYSIGGSVSGLTGNGLVLANGNDRATITANGSFRFATELASGARYSVSVVTHPVGQRCSIDSADGQVGSASVNVAVTCSDSQFTVGGTVTGLQGSGLELHNNSNDSRTIETGSPGFPNFSFGRALNAGNSYNIVVFRQPSNPSQACQVNPSSGTIIASNIDVVVSCINVYSLGGTISGLTANGLVLANGGNTVSPAANATTFSFFPSLPSGTAYNVTIQAQPPGHNCTLTGTTNGTISSNVSITVNCVAVPPGAPTLNVSGTNNPRQLSFSWTSVPGATSYKLFRDPGFSGFTQVGGDLGSAATSTTIDNIAVHLTRWANAAFRLDACNSAGCTPSTVIPAVNAMVQAIGYFKASNTGASDGFGVAVALSGDGNTLAVGASNETSASVGINGNQDDNSVFAAGAVYVFVRSGASWTQQAYIKASNTGRNDLFGGTLSLSHDGNTLAVGAYMEASASPGVNANQFDNSATGAGAVYIYSRSTSTWTQNAYIKASNAAAFDNFGKSLALSADGNTLAVAADSEGSAAIGIDGNQNDNSMPGAGAVYTFARSSGNWAQSSYIKASNTNQGDHFGWSLGLSADGNTLAVGAIYEASSTTGIGGNQNDNSMTLAGAVYLFTRGSGSAWSQQAYIKASNTAADDEFGRAIALSGDGNTLAISATGEDSASTGANGGDQSNNSASRAGAVYVFGRLNNAWSQQSYIKASNTGAEDSFGNSLSLRADGNWLAVGAIDEDSGSTGINGNQGDGTPLAGAVYVFERLGGTFWSQHAYVKASNTSVPYNFGAAVALSSDGQTLAVGSTRERSGSSGINSDQNSISANDSGAVYLY